MNSRRTSETQGQHHTQDRVIGPRHECALGRGPRCPWVERLYQLLGSRAGQCLERRCFGLMDLRFYWEPLLVSMIIIQGMHGDL